MLTDAQGLAVTTDSLEAIDCINQFADQLLGYGKEAAIIVEGVAVDRTSVLINAHAAAFYLFSETTASITQAWPFLQAAQAPLTHATDREQLYVSAIAAWADRDLNRALSYHEELADRYPRDLTSVFIAYYHYFFRGDNWALLKLIEKILPANQENHYVYGMLAFALEQCYRLEEAEAAGRHATQMQRCDPWAHHAVAHVMETQGRVDEGIAWMESLADTWEDCGSFFCHNWWHVALYYLAREDYAYALKLYDHQVWGRAAKDYTQCHVDAISLLLRLELRGTDVGDRWQMVGAYLPEHIYDHILPLIDVHYAYALVRSGQMELADSLIDSMQAYAAIAKPSIRNAWVDVVLPIAQGMIAHARCDWLSAIAHLRHALPKLQAVGGSHAQRNVFEQVYLNALLR
jgi:hypothetical protein